MSIPGKIYFKTGVLRVKAVVVCKACESEETIQTAFVLNPVKFVDTAEKLGWKRRNGNWYCSEH